MTFGTELKKIRYYLRDPDANLWDNDLLIDLYNQAQHDLQNDTRVLEDVSIVPVPPRYDMSYMHDCESPHITGLAYRCLRQNQNFFAYCAHFEVQENFEGDSSDVTDYGTIAYTHPFEAWYATPNKPPEFPFPDHFHSVKGIYYDEYAIEYRTKRDISGQDPSWETHSGTTNWYFREDEVSNTFTPYPRPSTATWTDIEGSGMVNFIEDDTTNQEIGVITSRTGSVLSGEDGVAVDALETTDNFTIIHDVTPLDIGGIGDEPDWPRFLLKYLRFRTLELAYMTNNDGRIPSLGRYWGNRYRIGVEAVKKFMAARKRDRVYRLKTQGVIGINRHKHPKLPDTFPAV